MTALSRTAAHRVIREAMNEMVSVEPQLSPGDLAYLLVREAALVMDLHRERGQAPEALYALADELVGAK